MKKVTIMILNKNDIRVMVENKSFCNPKNVHFANVRSSFEFEGIRNVKVGFSRSYSTIDKNKDFFVLDRQIGSIFFLPLIFVIEIDFL